MSVMAISSVSVTFSVMVLNVRHGGECLRGVPNWLRFLAFKILAPIVCYKTNEYRMKRWFSKQSEFQKAFLQLSERIKVPVSQELQEADYSPEFIHGRSVRFSENNVDNKFVQRSKSAKTLSAVPEETGDKCSRKHSSGINTESFVQLLHRVNQLTTRLENDFKNEEMFAEWRKVSHIFDLFFFGLIVFITFAVTVTMLVLAPMFSTLDIANRKKII